LTWQTAHVDRRLNVIRRGSLWWGAGLGFLFGAFPCVAATQENPPALSTGHVAAQFGVGLVGMPVGFLAGGLGTRWAARQLGADESQASSIAMAGAYTGAALATAAGPVIVGPGEGAKGSYWASLGGAVAGGVGSFLLIRLNRAVDLGTVPRIIGAVLVFALPSAGATGLYNATRSRR
jgi:hypothetical protein